MNIVDRLFCALDEFERAVDRTRGALAKSGLHANPILERFSFYDDILQKQRCLATNLRAHFERREWDEVIRNVRLITGLSAMVRDDAQALLAGWLMSNKQREFLGEKMN